jgi:hypothetical protein
MFQQVLVLVGGRALKLRCHIPQLVRGACLELISLIAGNAAMQLSCGNRAHRRERDTAGDAAPPAVSLSRQCALFPGRTSWCCSWGHPLTADSTAALHSVATCTCQSAGWRQLLPGQPWWRWPGWSAGVCGSSMCGVERGAWRVSLSSQGKVL